MRFYPDILVLFLLVVSKIVIKLSSCLLAALMVYMPVFVPTFKHTVIIGGKAADV